MEDTKATLKPVLVDIDPELWRDARIQALKEGISVQDWLNALIRKTLNKAG